VWPEQRNRLTFQTVRVARYHERGDAARTCSRTRPREDGVDVGIGRIGDERLRSEEPVAAGLRSRLERKCGRIRPGTWLRQRESRDRVAFGHRRDPPLPSCVRPRICDREGAETLEGEGRLRLRQLLRQRLAD